MAIFKVTASDGSAHLIVRAICITCSRQIAAENAPLGEQQIWSNAKMELIRNPERLGYEFEGIKGIIERVEHV